MPVRKRATVWSLLVSGVCAVACLVACTGPAGQPEVAGSTGAATSDATTRSPVESGPGPGVAAAELPFPEPPGADLPAARQDSLRRALDRVLEVSASATKVRGITAAVVTADGRWAGAAGVDGDDVALVPEAMMDIGSITKTVTAAEVVHLDQAGVIDLNAPASAYLDHPLLARYPTVRQLLSHTSGIPEFIDNESLFAAVLADPHRSWTPREVLATVTAPVTDPGRPVLDYSSSNYLLLGLLIEKVTGLGYAEAVRKDLFPGLGGAARIAVQDAEAPAPPLAAVDRSGGAVPDGHYVPNRSLASSVGPAGGIAADAATLALWGYRLYGGLVLPADRTQELTTPVARGYGLGTMLFPAATGQHPQVGHNGRLPGCLTLLLVDAADRISIAVLVVGEGGRVFDNLPADLAQDLLVAAQD